MVYKRVRPTFYLKLLNVITISTFVIGAITVSADTSLTLHILDVQVGKFDSMLILTSIPADKQLGFADGLSVTSASVAINELGYYQNALISHEESSYENRVVFLFNGLVSHEPDTQYGIRECDAENLDSPFPFFNDMRTNLLPALPEDLIYGFVLYERSTVTSAFSLGQSSLEKLLCMTQTVLARPEHNCLFEALDVALNENWQITKKEQSISDADFIVFSPSISEEDNEICKRESIQGVLEFARMQGVRIHVVPIDFGREGDGGYSDLYALAQATGGLSLPVATALNVGDVTRTYVNGMASLQTITVDLAHTQEAILPNRQYQGTVIAMLSNGPEVVQQFTFTTSEAIAGTGPRLRALLPSLLIGCMIITGAGAGWAGWQYWQARRRFPFSKTKSNSFTKRRQKNSARFGESIKPLILPEHSVVSIYVRKSPGKQLEGQTITVGKFPYYIGREDCDLTFQDPTKRISRRHLVLIKSEDQLFIRDEGSSNGTLLNSIRLVPQHNLSISQSENEINISDLVELQLSIQS